MNIHSQNFFEMKDNLINQNTQAWRFQVWATFALSFGGMVIGIWFLPASLWIKGFLAMGLVATVSSCFTLAKTVRDDHEADRLINRVSSAKTERILTEYENKET